MLAEMKNPESELSQVTIMMLPLLLQLSGHHNIIISITSGFIFLMLKDGLMLLHFASIDCIYLGTGAKSYIGERESYCDVITSMKLGSDINDEQLAYRPVSTCYVEQ